MAVLLVFALVFLPVGWFIWRMLRYTAQTVGNESPLNTTLTRSYSFLSHFFGGNSFFALLFAIQGFMFLSLIPGMRWPDNYPWAAISLMTFIIVMMLGMAGFLYWMQWQYWLIIRNKVVTYVPELLQIYVEQDSETWLLSEESVQKIENHTAAPDAGKFVRSYGYFVFHLKSGQIVTLSETFFGWPEIMQRYLGRVPLEIFYYKIPTVKQEHISS